MCQLIVVVRSMCFMRETNLSVSLINVINLRKCCCFQRQRSCYFRFRPLSRSEVTSKLALYTVVHRYEKDKCAVTCASDLDKRQSSTPALTESSAVDKRTLLL